MIAVLRRTAIATACLVTLYGMVGAVIIPRFVTSSIESYVHAHAHTAKVGWVHFNPFTLTLDASGITVKSPSGRSVLEVSKINLQIGWSTFFGRETFLRDLHIDIDSAQVSRRADGTLDLFDLVPATDPSRPWPRITALHGTLSAHSIRFIQPAAGPDGQVLINALALKTDNFSLRAPSSEWIATLDTDRKESAKFRGKLSLTPLSVSGTLHLDNLDLSRFGPEGAAYLPEISGRASTQAEFSWKDGPTPVFFVPSAMIEGRELHVALAPAPGLALSTPSWSIGQFAYDGLTHSASLDKVTSQSPELHLFHSAKGWVGLDNDASSQTLVRYGELTVLDGTLLIHDSSGSRPASLKANHMFVHLSPVDSGLRTVRGSATVGANGQIKADGTLGEEAGLAKLNIDVSHLSITDFTSYLEPLIALRIDSAFLTTRGFLQHEGDDWHFTGSASLDDVRTHDLMRQRDFLGVHNLQVEDIDAHWPSLMVKAKAIVAEAPYADVRINPDGQLNITSLVPKKRTTSVKDTRLLAVETTRVVNGRLFFSDETQSPTFEAGIADLSGQIDGLSSDPQTHAHLAFSGHVDRYAPVSIEGDANLIGDPISADVRMHFNNLELTGLSPYSGQFAGYRIRKGKATADLSYKIQNHQLDASHHVRLKQFELGEKVEGQGGFGIPLGLVVSLLKDADGNIDLDVPLTGNFSDPNFHLGQITHKVIGNLFSKIVTSPFALLGRLFGAGGEIAWIDFSAGSSSLEPSSRVRIATLARAMTARPKINIDIPITTTSLDASALAAIRYQELVLSRARIQLGDLDDATLLTRLNDLPDVRRSVLSALLGTNEGLAHADLQQLESEVRRNLTPNIDDLEQLANARAGSIQAALVEGTGIDPGRIFLVRSGEATATDGTIHLKLGIH